MTASSRPPTNRSTASIVVVCCATDDTDALRRWLAPLGHDPHELEIVDGVHTEPHRLREAIERRHGQGLYVLCRSPHLNRAHVETLREILLAAHVPFARTLTVAIGHQSGMVDRIRSGLRRIHAPRGAPAPSPRSVASPSSPSGTVTGTDTDRDEDEEPTLVGRRPESPAPRSRPAPSSVAPVRRTERTTPAQRAAPPHRTEFAGFESDGRVLELEHALTPARPIPLDRPPATPSKRPLHQPAPRDARPPSTVDRHETPAPSTQSPSIHRTYQRPDQTVKGPAPAHITGHTVKGPAPSATDGLIASTLMVVSPSRTTPPAQTSPTPSSDPPAQGPAPDVNSPPPVCAPTTATSWSVSPRSPERSPPRSWVLAGIGLGALGLGALGLGLAIDRSSDRASDDHAAGQSSSSAPPHLPPAPAVPSQPSPPPEYPVVLALESRQIRALDVLLIATAISTPRDYPSATHYCDALDVEGLSRWRLPVVGELRSLSVARMITEHGYYWSSTAADTFGDTHLAWNIRQRYAQPHTDEALAVCVRGTTNDR